MFGRIKTFLKSKFVMNGYYGDLVSRVTNYESRFPGNPKLSALRLIWWNFKSLFKVHRAPTLYTKKKAKSINAIESNFNKKFEAMSEANVRFYSVCMEELATIYNAVAPLRVDELRKIVDRNLIAEKIGDEINIVFITDNKYAYPTSVAISSLFYSSNPETNYKVYVIGSDLNEETERLLLRSGPNIVVENIPGDVITIDFKHSHVSTAAMFKFLIADIFPQLDRILYLDSDIIVQGDLKAFYNTDLGQNYIAAIPDYHIMNNLYAKARELINSPFYFNSGVILMNLRQMREDNISEKLIQTKLSISNDKTFTFMDQDALNIVFNGKTVKASPDYNFLNVYYEEFDRFAMQALAELSADEVASIFRNPTILHLGGGTKPWSAAIASKRFLYQKYEKINEIYRDYGLNNAVEVYAQNNSSNRADRVEELRLKFKRCELLLQSVSDDCPTSFELDPNEVRIAFVTSGGLGDHLLFTNYLFHFMQKFNHGKVSADVFFKDKFGLAPYLLKRDSICSGYYPLEKLQNSNYMLVLNLAGFPKVEYCDEVRLSTLAPDIMTYANLCNDYKEYSRSAFRGNAYGMMCLCDLEGRTLLQRGDIYGHLGITEFKYPVFIDSDEDAYLSQIGLKPKAFITIQTGCDVIYPKHIKLWPIQYYRALVEKISKDYPELTIVQIGNSGEVCVGNIPTGMNLLNVTNIDQAKILLKHSLLHIDIEGGLVHLRHALKGGVSLVLFGPTPVQFFGYEDNCNLRSNICNTPCYQMTSAWPTTCPKCAECVPCMETLTPEMVFEKFDELMCSLNSASIE